jgi:hypothetical protein
MIIMICGKWFLYRKKYTAIAPPQLEDKIGVSTYK